MAEQPYRSYQSALAWKSMKAIDYLLERIKSNGRLAWLLGDTEALDLLVQAHIHAHGLAPEFAERYRKSLRPEKPVCRACGEIV